MYDADGKISHFTMNPLLNSIFLERLKGDGTVEELEGNFFYPSEYFNPLEYTTGRMKKTANTRSIHWYLASWLPPQPKWLKFLKRMYHRIFR